MSSPQNISGFSSPIYIVPVNVPSTNRRQNSAFDSQMLINDLHSKHKTPAFAKMNLPLDQYQTNPILNISNCKFKDDGSRSICRDIGYFVQQKADVARKCPDEKMISVKPPLCKLDVRQFSCLQFSCHSFGSDTTCFMNKY